MGDQRGLIQLPGHLPVEVDILLMCDVGLRLRPQGDAFGDPPGLFARRRDEINRRGDRARVLTHDAFNPPAVEKFIAVGVEMQRDAGADGGRLFERQSRDLIGALAV